MNTSITKSRLKELVKEVMVEENEYQAFFKKALAKAGKGINDMTDDEKKAFFNKIDTAWNGKGEKSESKMNELEFDSKEEMDAYKKAHNVRPGTELKLAPITKRVGHAITKGAEKVGDKVMNTVGKALYTTKVGNAAMKGIGHASNAVTKKMGLDNMNDKESDAEVDAWKDYYKKK
jgi:hypothetical protein